MTIAKTLPVPDVLFMSVSEFDDSRHLAFRRVYSTEKAARNIIKYYESETRKSYAPISHRVFRCDMVNMTIKEITDPDDLKQYASVLLFDVDSEAESENWDDE